MADIHIHRDHQLGLAEAREIAKRWAAQAEKKFELTCKLTESETSDTLEFSRSGLKGRLIVTATSLDVSAELGLMMAPFSKMVEMQIENQIDKLLDQDDE